MATLSLFGLYQLAPDLWDDFTIPAPLSNMKENLITNIMLDSISQEVYITDPNILKLYLGVWSKSRLSVWQHLYETTQYVYNPTENYNMVETEFTDSKSNTENASTTESTNKNDYTKTDKHTSDDTTSTVGNTQHISNNTESSTEGEKGSDTLTHGLTTTTEDTTAEKTTENKASNTEISGSDSGTTKTTHSGTVANEGTSSLNNSSKNENITTYGKTETVSGSTGNTHTYNTNVATRNDTETRNAVNGFNAAVSVPADNTSSITSATDQKTGTETDAGTNESMTKLGGSDKTSTSGTSTDTGATSNTETINTSDQTTENRTTSNNENQTLTSSGTISGTGSHTSINSGNDVTTRANEKTGKIISDITDTTDNTETVKNKGNLSIDSAGTDNQKNSSLQTENEVSKNNTDRTLKRSGNIGVTTTQQMIESERQLARFNILDVIKEETIDKFCLLCY